MKKLLLSLAFISLISFTNAQWITLNSGTTNSLSSVYFTNYNTGYAISGYVWYESETLLF